MTPSAQAAQFLEQHGWTAPEITAVAGDASFRRYFRVVSGTRHAILMDAPPPHEDPKPFVDIACHLRAQGFAAPEILAQDLAQGLVLLEDFGDQRMREHLDEHPQDEKGIYTQVVDLLAELRLQPAAELPPYSRDEYLREVNLLTEWYCPAQELEVDLAGFETAWDEVLVPVLEEQTQPVTVLRDYHAENIMLLEDGRLGLLDFQDALAGHRAYDLVSMLQDARRDVSDDLETAMITHYLSVTGEPDPDQFRSHYAILGAQRNTKIIGIFTRLCKRDGKVRYLDFLPRMWGLLEKDLRHPDLSPVAVWFDQNIPVEIRTRPVPVDVAAS
ncbi:MAG: phosphotransferase [Pseudomonadota bacterium]